MFSHGPYGAAHATYEPINPTLNTMSRNLYSPRLSDDVVRALYREGRRRRMPMTRLADDLLRQSLCHVNEDPPALHLREEEPAEPPTKDADAA